MESKHDYYGTQYGMGTDPVTVPPAPLPPVGQGLPGHPPPIQWMPPPPAIYGWPRGLEYLTALDQMMVQPQLPERTCCCCYRENKYFIKNALGQQIFFANEEPGECCGGGRGFTMHVVDNTNQEVIRVVRPFQCCAVDPGCADSCSSCAFTITVEAPPGSPIGHVRQRESNWKPHYDILDATYQPILKIRGPCCFCQAICCTGDVNFRLMTYNDFNQIGTISKQWVESGRDCCTSADNFHITFPVDLDVKVKATLLGALFLIDFMFYEEERSS